MSDKARVTIGIITYNGAERLAWLLESIAMRTPEIGEGAAQVVVVDDGSPRCREIEEVVTGAQFAAYILHPTNLGISAAWNTATRAFDSEIVVLLNDDVIVSAGWLAAITHPLVSSPGVGGVGANWHAFLDEDVPALLAGPFSDRNVVPRDPVTKAHAPERRLYESHNPGRVMCPTGQLFAFRRTDFDAIGGFDETYKSFFEESCFGTSMAAQLGKIGFQLNWPMCWHKWSATFAASPELLASARMQASRRHYIEKWHVPPSHQGDRPGPFDYTNPKYLGAIGDVAVEFIKQDGSIGRGTLRRDGAFVER